MNFKTMMMGLALLCLFSCQEAEDLKEGADKTADQLTGKAPLEKKKKLKEQIENIVTEHNKRLEEQIEK